MTSTGNAKLHTSTYNIYFCTRKQSIEKVFYGDIVVKETYSSHRYIPCVKKIRFYTLAAFSEKMNQIPNAISYAIFWHRMLAYYVDRMIVLKKK